MRVIEWFSGLGGWRLALGTQGRVVVAYDVSPAANATYTLNHGEVPRPREVASLPSAEVQAHLADTWLMSPPCQPFCRMGTHRDLEDPRSRALLHLLTVLQEAPPRHLVLENVEGFLHSQAHERLSGILRALGMHQLDLRACPSRFGLPNQRPRVYVVASREPLMPRVLPDRPRQTLSAFLDAREDESLYLEHPHELRHRVGLDLVAPEDERSACFIGGYGRRFVGSGSFLETGKGIRRFSPAEIARLLGLPEAFQFPPELSREARYRLLGNSLSIPVARWALDHLPGR